MKKITVNGQAFLGSIRISNETITVHHAIADVSNTLEQADFATYFKQKNLDKLQTITFAGHGTTYSVTDLTEDEELGAHIVLLSMRRAKKMALHNLENGVLDTLLGKL